MNNKSRHWTFIVYPESCSGDWIDRLIETGCPFAISPLHKDDINPDGTKKKAHFHVILNFDGPTTYNNVKSLCDSIKATIPKRVMSLRGAYRYLCHLDNPEKAQYKTTDISVYNNFNIERTETEIFYDLSKIVLFINDSKDIDNIVELINYYLINGDMDNFRICVNKFYFLSNYIEKLNKKNYN